MAKITYENKVALNVNSDIADVNKCNATDLNEIKNVVNENDDNTITNTNNIAKNAAKIGTLSNLNTTNKNNLVSAINEANNKFNCSTSEQVIGTDENGKPIYKRSFSGATTNNDFTSFTSDYNASNIIIKKAYGSIQASNRGVAIGGYVNSNYFAGLFIHTSELQIYYGASLKNGTYNITIEFTKTTD